MNLLIMQCPPAFRYFPVNLKEETMTEKVQERNSELSSSEAWGQVKNKPDYTGNKIFGTGSVPV
jgi:hypothetical protein